MKSHKLPCGCVVTLDDKIVQSCVKHQAEWAALHAQAARDHQDIATHSVSDTIPVT